MSISARINRRNRSHKAWFKYCVAALTSCLVISSIFIPPAIATSSKSFQPVTCVQIQTIPTENKFDKASISFLSSDNKVLGFKCETTAEKVLKVADEKLLSRLDNFLVGDRVNLTYNNDKGELSSISTVDVSVSFKDRLWAFVLPALVLFGVGTIALWSAKGKVCAIGELFVGYDKRLSNSKSQAAIWFFVLIASYLSITYLRILFGGFDFVGGISIPQNLLVLSGISAFTYAGSKAITQSQVNRNPNSKTIANDGTASLSDYFTDDDGNTEFGDFQMTIITLLAVVVFLVQIFNFIGVVSLSKSIAMPDLDTTMLSLFVLGQGAYLAKKTVAASGATDAKAATDSKVLKLGVKDKKVIDIKKALNNKFSLSGDDALDVSSDHFDDKTKEKVIVFQDQEKLSPADGIVDATTLSKLLGG